MFLIFRRIKAKEEAEQITFSKEEQLHLRSLRVSAKEIIYLGDGHHRRWPMRLVLEKGTEKKEWLARVSGPFRSHHEPIRIVCMALPERSRLEKEFLPAAVQLGMSHFQPLICENSVASHLRKKRIRSILKESACQSRRFFLPRLLRTKSTQDLHSFLERISLAPKNILVFHPQAELSFETYHEKNPHLQKEKATILLGPEGGFSPKEVADFQGRSYTLLRLGSGENILRAGTAGLAALAKLL